MMGSVESGIGARIASARKLAGLTQASLARRIGYSKSMVSKVEQGSELPTPEFVGRVAEALGGHADRLEWNRFEWQREDDRLADQLGPVRAALDLLDLPPDSSVAPRPTSVLDADVRDLNLLAQAAQYEPMIALFPPLLAEVHLAAEKASGREREDLWALLALAARCGHSVGIAVGDNDLSVYALSRMDWAAKQAGRHASGLRAAREYLRVTAYLRNRDYDACWRLNRAGVAHLDGAEDTPGALLARGQLHLGASVIAARTGDRDSMAGHLDEAARIAAVTGEQPEQFWFGFGPTNVQVHRTVTLGTIGEHGRAVEAGRDIRFPSVWLPTRIGHHHLDMARAYRWLNKPEHALRELERARLVAPGQARRHPMTRDTVAALVRSSRRQSDALTDYAAWLGLTP
ncbi:Helix-turn-helix domain-containing protein [Amycolatopsis rubida]|uniref:Helix-turn-helix domain-containing protein n=1 Tax=Amycolatopsis rubida TaxID=112413 RepID=A0A1I5WC20_9PSEU|nr:Helix-turn-helix domain-containing protein [Amycolatopsis rubida]